MPDSSDASVAVFICSSDSRRDILDRVLPSLLLRWRDCPYPIYIGVNSKIVGIDTARSVTAEPADWRNEVAVQISQLAESHVILMLDDYMFLEPVDQKQLSSLVAKAIMLDLPYLRLLPVGKSLRERLRTSITPEKPAQIAAIASGRPFYSSLQIALWNKAHFLRMLQPPGSIWEFEHRQTLGVVHYAITQDAPFIYRHMVERGRWLPYARRLLAKAGLPSELGVRKVWPNWVRIKLIFDELRYYVLGHGIH